MAAINPAVTQRLVHYGQAVAAAPWGCKSAIYEEAAVELGMSSKTVIKKIAQVTTQTSKPRKRRSDAGTTALTKQEAARIAMDVMEHMRKNGKRIESMKEAVEE